MATVLREGPDKHWGKDYYLSIEVLKMSEFAKILSDFAGYEIKINNLNKQKLFKSLLKGIHWIFLLTGYSSEILYQSKLLIDANKKVGIEFIEHLGVYSSKNDFIPNFFCQDLIGCFI